eukprot:Nk52_evm18s292 gene=Nk52_evmTU18s292
MMSGEGGRFETSTPDNRRTGVNATGGASSGFASTTDQGRGQKYLPSAFMKSGTQSVTRSPGYGMETPMRNQMRTDSARTPRYTPYGESSPMNNRGGGSAGTQNRGSSSGVAQPPPTQSLHDTVSIHRMSAVKQRSGYGDDNLNQSFQEHANYRDGMVNTSVNSPAGGTSRVNAYSPSSQGLGNNNDTPQSGGHLESSVMTSPNQVDPFYTQGEALNANEGMDNRWVTVFGFPPSASAVILKQFLLYGDIIQHIMAPQGGNWMYIQYQSEVQAQKALSKNGNVINGVIMLGVVPTIDVDIIKGSGNNAVPSSSTPRQLAPRALTNAYKNNAAKYEVEPFSAFANTPQKNSSILSKGLEYVFGW